MNTTNKKYRKCFVNGKLFIYLTISELSEIVNKSPHALRKLEHRGYLKRPNLLKDQKRYYSLELAEKLAELIPLIKQGIKTDNEVRRQIWLAFDAEKIRLRHKAGMRYEEALAMGPIRLKTNKIAVNTPPPKNMNQK